MKRSKSLRHLKGTQCLSWNSSASCCSAVLILYVWMRCLSTQRNRLEIRELACTTLPFLPYTGIHPNAFKLFLDMVSCSCCRGPIYFTESLRQYDIRCYLTTNKKHLVMTLHTHNKKLYWENVLYNAIANLEMEDWQSYGPWGISTNSNWSSTGLGQKSIWKKKSLIKCTWKDTPFLKGLSIKSCV